MLRIINKPLVVPQGTPQRKKHPIGADLVWRTAVERSCSLWEALCWLHHRRSAWVARP